MTIHSQRVAAVQELDALGYKFDNGQWISPHGGNPVKSIEDLIAVADAMLEEITGRCAELAMCVAGSPEAKTLNRLTLLAQAYKDVRPKT